MIHRLDRSELKYVITNEMRARLMPEMLANLRADENAVEGAHYPVVSLYYDTALRDCYWENIRGIKSRRKMRVRVYGSLDGVLPPTTFAEIKHKVDGRNVKRRARLPLEEALAAAAGEPIHRPMSISERRTIEEIHMLVHESAFQPVCCIRYNRHAYMAMDPNVDLRVTFDTGIAYRFGNLDITPDDRNFEHYLTDAETAVMEVKVTGAVPYWFSKLVATCGCLLQAHSKYCRALEAGDPVVQRRLHKPEECLT